ncbi:MAG: relaxase/mobilization nuclease domain-containing protein [Sediminibacterium sp.]
MKALYYNENKVAKGKAVCLHAGGFLRDERAKTKTLHISLNFDPSEKPSDAQLKEIATAYLKGIGFEGQPYLVYRHNDAGHPHIHIVTTTIREDGSRINTHNIGRNQSEVARKEIEKKYGLVVAGNKSKKNTAISTPKPVQYGQAETKKSIAQVVSFVVTNYAFTSIHELNAVLRKYGVEASTGEKGSRLQKYNGLHYRMLDKNNKPIGVPLKASSLPGKPTLYKLESLYEKNSEIKQRFKFNVKAQVDESLTRAPKDLKQLRQLMNDKNIDLFLRQSTDGRIYGVTFVDHSNKVVMNGSDLGKAYSARHLQERLKTSTNQPFYHEPQTASLNSSVSSSLSLTELLLTPVQEYNTMSGALVKKKRKRKRKYLGI